MNNLKPTPEGWAIPQNSAGLRWVTTSRTGWVFDGAASNGDRYSIEESSSHRGQYRVWYCAGGSGAVHPLPVALVSSTIEAGGIALGHHVAVLEHKKAMSLV